MYSPKVRSETFEQVYERELADMVRLATFMLGSQPLAEEAVQDAFIKLHSNWFSIKNPGGFLRTAVVNRCKDLMRHKVRSRKHLRLISNVPPVTESAHYLVDALQKLGPKRRTIVVLKFYGGYTLAEVAETMNLPEGTVRSNFYRGLEELREVLPR